MPTQWSAVTDGIQIKLTFGETNQLTSRRRRTPLGWVLGSQLDWQTLDRRDLCFEVLACGGKNDLTVVRHMADVIGVLYLGRLVEEAAPEDLFTNPKHPYTQMLLDAAPQMDGFGREVPPPQGEIPDPINPPSGCAFHPRCPIAQDICREKRPEPRFDGVSRVACHLAE